MANKKGVPNLPDIQSLIVAGINPRTGLPIKASSGHPEYLDVELRKAIRIMDEQDAVNRYTWTNIPCNLTSQDIERLIYYKGQLVFFYLEALEEFYFMPYALDGTIDFYGRFNTVHPVPMTSGSEDDKARVKAQTDLLSKIKLKCIYDVVDIESEKDPYKVMTTSGVLIHDYSKQMSQIIIPRSQLNEPIITVMAECIPFMRTSLVLGSGVKGLRVGSADEADSVKTANQTIVDSAKSGEAFIPITANLELQELLDGQPIKSEEYMIAMQSIDNFRKSTYGIDNGGLFEKKAHILESENQVNMSACMNQLQDGLSIRQNFCNIVNSIWDLGIWCEPSENVVMQDLDGDGMIDDDNDDGSMSGYDGEESEDSEE